MRRLNLRELEERLDLRERLAAIVDELGQLDPDLVDVPATIAAGLLEELDLLLADEEHA